MHLSGQGDQGGAAGDGGEGSKIDCTDRGGETYRPANDFGISCGSQRRQLHAVVRQSLPCEPRFRLQIAYAGSGETELLGRGSAYEPW